MRPIACRATTCSPWTPVEPAGTSPGYGSSQSSVGPRTRGRPEPAMTIARSVADVLRNHVVLEYEAIDRMYLNVYVPHLQTVGDTAGVSAGAPWPAVCFDGGGGADDGGFRSQRRGIGCG